MDTARSFANVHIRWLPLWLLAAGSLMVIIDWIRPMGSKDPWALTLAVYIGDGVLLLWVLRQCARAGISIGQLLGTRPRAWREWDSISVVPPTILFNLGCSWLWWFPLSYLLPGLTARALVSDSPLRWNSRHPVQSALMALLGVVIAPVVEELVFRGIVLRRWAFKWGVWRGLLASSAVFGLLHGPSAPGLIAFGVVMGLVYIKTSNLWVPIGCHMLNNALALTSQFVPIWNNSDETIAQFQHEWYIGLSCLVVGLAGLVALGRHFLPRQGLRLPEPAT